MNPRSPAARTRGRRRVATIAAFAVAAFVPGSASAQDAPPPAPDPGTVAPVPVWERLPDPRLTPGLVQLPVHSRAYDAAVAAWEQTLIDIDTAQRTIAESNAALSALTTTRATEREQLELAQAELVGSFADLDLNERSINHVAVQRYMSGGPSVDAINLIGSPNPGDDVYDRAVAEQVSDTQLEIRASTLARVTELEVDVATRTASLVEVGTTMVDTKANLDDATARLITLDEALPRREQAVRDRRLGALVADTDITLVVLDAYVKAASRLRDDRPSCGLEWWMIAALGRIESRHGTIFGAEVRPDGRTSFRIIGIPLDGTNNTASIPDTDGGVLDGDTEFDRAVGPMQFIPSTWSELRRDGNGDGQRDPHNIYDAAATAGAFLCARGGALTGEDALRRAYLAYNRSSSYASTAISNGATYRALTLPST